MKNFTKNTIYTGCRSQKENTAAKIIKTDMKESFVFLADGFEEIEALTAVDVLRRGGMNVKTVSITRSFQVKGAHGISVNADVIYDNVMFGNAEWLILPGGMPGAENLHKFSPLVGLLHRQAESENGKIAAICAAPAVVLGQEGLLSGHKATCYPGFEELMQGADVVNEPAVTDGKFVTGNGPSSALVWALTILKEARGFKIAQEVASGMLLYVSNDSNVDHFFG